MHKSYIIKSARDAERARLIWVQRRDRWTHNYERSSWELQWSEHGFWGTSETRRTGRTERSNIAGSTQNRLSPIERQPFYGRRKNYELAFERSKNGDDWLETKTLLFSKHGLRLPGGQFSLSRLWNLQMCDSTCEVAEAEINILI